MRTCTKCKQQKKETEFHQRPNYHDTDTIYYKSECKVCTINRMTNWVKENRQKYRTYQNQYMRKRYWLNKEEDGGK